MKRLTLWDCAFILAGLALIVLGFIAYELYSDNQLLKQIAENTSEPPQTPAIAPVSPSDSVTSINPHETEIKRLESESGVFLSRISKLIIAEEGTRSRPYLDPNKQVTIGIGRNLQGNGISVSELHAIAADIDYRLLMRESHIRNGRVYIGSINLANKVFAKPLSEYDIQLLLADDLKNVVKEAEQVFGNTWQRLDSVRKEVIVDVLFNLGLPEFRQFVKFIAAVNTGNWDVAASELLLSEAARENIVRYHRAATVLRTGDAKYFGL